MDKVRLQPVFCAAALLLSLTLTLGGRSAQANGRPPNTTGLVLQQGNPNQAVALVTFGLLVAKANGLRWQLVCETAVTDELGFRGVDPQVLYSAGGQIIVASFDTVAVSVDQGCSWRKSPPFMPGQLSLQVTGAALHPSDPSTFYVSAAGDDGGALYATADAGLTYTRLPLSAGDLNLQAVAVAASAPATLVALGSNRNTFAGPTLLKSTDAGASWSISGLLAGGPAQTSTMQLRIHPQNPQIMWMAVTDAGSGGVVLLRSQDGGTTTAAVLRVGDPLVSLAVSPDGAQVVLASRRTLYRSQDGGLSFAALSTPSANACATFGPPANGLTYACGNGAADGFAMALSHDAGNSWVPLMQLAQIDAVLRCPADSPTARICGELWPTQAQAIGAPLRDSAGGTVALDGQQNLQAPPAAAPNAAAPASGASSSAAKKGGCMAGTVQPSSAWLGACALGACMWLRRRRR